MASEATIIANAKKAGVKEYLAKQGQRAKAATVEGAKKAAAFATAKWNQAKVQPNIPQIATGIAGTGVGVTAGTMIQSGLDRATSGWVKADEAGQTVSTTPRKIVVHFAVPVLGTAIAVGSAMLFKKHGVGAAFGMGLGIGALIGSLLRSINTPLAITAVAPGEV